jgi:TnpA family transposase
MSLVEVETIQPSPITVRQPQRALNELGRAVKTIFLRRYLHNDALRREFNEGLNVVEQWNGANSFIFYGKNSEIATNRLDEQLPETTELRQVKYLNNQVELCAPIYQAFGQTGYGLWLL